MNNKRIIQEFPAPKKNTLKYNEKRISLFEQMKEFTPSIKKNHVSYHSDADYYLQRPFVAMLPNIAFECAKFRDCNIDDFDHLREQIETYKYYTQLFMQDFITTCNEKLDQLRCFENLAKRATQFRIHQINDLPIEIIKYVYSYLTPETRLQCYGPIQSLETLSIKSLRCIVERCNIIFFDTEQRLYLDTDEATYKEDSNLFIMTYNGNTVRRIRKCMDLHSRKFYNTARTKKAIVNIIMDVIDAWNKTAKKCPTNLLRHIFHTNALRVFHMLKYFIQMKNISLHKS